MAFKIFVTERTATEIEVAIDYYSLYSSKAPLDFTEAIKIAYTSLMINPFYAIRYKNVRSLKLRKFPYSLYFTVNEINKTVRVLSCFQNQQNPRKRPRVTNL
jgi:toxin ParE1/3/4